MSQAPLLDEKDEWYPRDMEDRGSFRIFGVRRGFEIALLASVAMHLLVLTAMFVDETILEEPEFKTLNIQLRDDGGDEDTLASLLRQAQQASSPRQLVEAQRIVETNEPSENTKKLKAQENDEETIVKAESLDKPSKKNANEQQGNTAQSTPAAKRITTQPKPAIKPQQKTTQEKKPLGNSNASDAEALIRYEQLLPLWLNRFRTYPPIAKQMGLEGEGVVFLNINREGKVLFASIARSTGHQILDNALLSMVASANPVIPVPKDYHAEENEFSYQIVFRFKLDEDPKIPVYE